MPRPRHCRALPQSLQRPTFRSPPHSARGGCRTPSRDLTARLTPVKSAAGIRPPPDTLTHRSGQTRHCRIAEVFVMPLHSPVIGNRHTAVCGWLIDRRRDANAAASGPLHVEATSSRKLHLHQMSINGANVMRTSRSRTVQPTFLRTSRRKCTAIRNDLRVVRSHSIKPFGVNSVSSHYLVKLACFLQEQTDARQKM